MKVERPNHRELTPEELAHLEKLRRLVQTALADGKLSKDETQRIWAAIYADQKVTVEELQIRKQTIQEVIGETILEYDWD
jgi:hypothetical protein